VRRQPHQHARAVGALAFGIGTTEVGHVLATQCLLQRKPRTLAVNVSGELRAGVTAKDLILTIIGRLGVSGGTGHVIEYRGDTIRALDMDERMTVCQTCPSRPEPAPAMIGPDETTYRYLEGRPRSPRGAAWERALEAWRALPTDALARFDREVELDAAAVEPMITYGTNPGMSSPSRDDPAALRDAAFTQALTYMGLAPGQPIRDQPVNVVFLGSCTNARLSDLRSAAGLLRGRRIAPGLRMLVVPGSQQVKREAEAEGLDRVFLEAGAEWRESGCSMCLGMNGDVVGRASTP